MFIYYLYNEFLFNIKKIHKLLNPFFKYAEKEGYIEKNPCSNITLPKDKDIDVDEIIEKQKIPFKYFTPDEIKILRDAFADNKYKEVVDFAKRNNILVVSDLAYGHLTYDGYKPLSILSIDGALDVCVEIHSMSKSFNMTGWRLAFVVGSEKFIKLFSNVKSNTDSGQFRAIQKAGAFALDNYHLVDINRERYSRRLDLLTKTLKEVGFDAVKPKAGFYIYVPIPKGVKGGIRFESAEDATLYILANALISTVPWDDCGSYLRFSVTYDADTLEDEINIMEEIKSRLLSLNLEF